jgi:hypothetical protein
MLPFQQLQDKHQAQDWVAMGETSFGWDSPSQLQHADWLGNRPACCLFASLQLHPKFQKYPGLQPEITGKYL